MEDEGVVMTVDIAVVFLLAFIALQEHLNRSERKKLIEFILAKGLMEFKQGEAMEKDSDDKDSPPEKPDLEPIDQVSDDMFDKAIRKELGRETVVEKTFDALKSRVRGKKNG